MFFHCQTHWYIWLLALFTEQNRSTAERTQNIIQSQQKLTAVHCLRICPQPACNAARTQTPKHSRPQKPLVVVEKRRGRGNN
jgi:hypothetical protein